MAKNRPLISLEVPFITERMNSIGKRMYEVRISQGLPRIKVAQEVGVSLKTVCLAEAGQFTIAYLLIFARRTNTNPGWLITGKK